MMTDSNKLMYEDIQRHLEGLNRTTDGQLLYRMIERNLSKRGMTTSGPVAKNFVRFMHMLLGRYSNDTRANPVTRVKARLIQQHLSIHMGDSPVPQTGRPAKAASTAAQRQSRQTATAAPAGSPIAKKAKPGPEITTQAVGTTEVVTPAVRNELASKIADTVEQNKEFNQLLRSNLRAMKLAENADDLMDLKTLLVKGMEELLQCVSKMGGDLDETSGWLQQVALDHQLMQEKLANATKQSPLDAVTGLPRRDAMQRYVKAEVGRAQRYGFSVAFAILGIDGLEQIGTRFGMETMNEVLRIYGRDVFSRMRSYDVAVRYGVDQFALLFPNTQKNGAEKALEKLQKLASGLVYRCGGQSVSLPGFSSVLTMYVAGENPDTLLERADAALSMAKMKGGHHTLYLAPAG
jgi:diguanylate cyclase (GGDEF)-like protein